VELVASSHIRSTRDLKGKNVVSDVIDTKVFISMFVAYVGLDPEKDINWVTVPNWDEMIRFPFSSREKSTHSWRGRRGIWNCARR
jgi:hypothetical protein